MPGLPIIKRPFRDIAAQHILQAHGLSAELERIAGILPGLAPLVFHGIGLPQPLPSGKRDAGASPAIFQHIALAGNPQPGREHADPPGDHQISPALLERGVVGVFMKDRPVRGAVVLCPLVLDVDEGPSPPAKAKMLQAG